MSKVLKKYLKQNGITREKFAAEIGVTVHTVGRYINGVRDPDKEIKEKIYIVTHGYVRPDHFYDLPELNSASLGGVSHFSLPVPANLPGQQDFFAEASS